jgi:hypothetical protein
MRYHSVIGPHGIGPPHLPPRLVRSSDTGTPLVHHNLPLPPLHGSATHNTYSLAAYGPTRLPAIAGQPPASAPAQAPTTGTSHQLQVSATHGLHTVATGQLRRTQLPHTSTGRSKGRAAAATARVGGPGQVHAPHRSPPQAQHDAKPPQQQLLLLLSQLRSTVLTCHTINACSMHPSQATQQCACSRRFSRSPLHCGAQHLWSPTHAWASMHACTQHTR